MKAKRFKVILDIEPDKTLSTIDQQTTVLSEGTWSINLKLNMSSCCTEILKHPSWSNVEDWTVSVSSSYRCITIGYGQCWMYHCRFLRSLEI